MKFYNPFKPHIVKIGATYAVRRMCFTTFLFWPSWEYRDSKDNYWWNTSSHVLHYCMNNTLEESRKLLQRLKPKVQPKAEYVES